MHKRAVSRLVAKYLDLRGERLLMRRMFEAKDGWVWCLGFCKKGANRAGLWKD